MRGDGSNDAFTAGGRGKGHDVPKQRDHDGRALARWETEGGALDAASTGHRACLPRLPDGWHAQPVLHFRDLTGFFSYELNHVYRPAEPHGDPPLDLRRIELASCYWVVTWPDSSGADERPAGRWMTYAQARTLRGRLSFVQFSSASRAELAALFHARDGSAFAGDDTVEAHGLPAAS
jgi:hypothetical protein